MLYIIGGGTLFCFLGINIYKWQNVFIPLCRVECLTGHLITGSYQIENEYGNVESSFGKGGRDYVKWAARMAKSLAAGVPWVMCRQPDAPDDIVY